MVTKPVAGALNWDVTLNAALDALESGYQQADAAHLGAADPHGDRAYTDSLLTAKRGQSNGLASLDSDGKVPTNQLRDGVSHAHDDVYAKRFDTLCWASAATAQALTVTGASGQSDDVLRVRDVGGTKKVWVNSDYSLSALEMRLESDGTLRFRGSDGNHYAKYDSASDGPQLRGYGGAGLYSVTLGNAWHRWLRVARDGVEIRSGRSNDIPNKVYGAAGHGTDLTRWYNSSGTTLAFVEYDGSLNAPWVQAGGATFYSGALNVQPKGTGSNAQAIKALTGQTASLSVWLNSANGLLASIQPTGEAWLTVYEGGTLVGLRKVEVGAADSAGVGYRTVRVANA